MNNAISRLVEPRSVAIVGISPDERSLGGFVLDNLERFEYRGDVHLVSRSHGEIHGRRCVKSIDELPAGIDVALLMLPEKAVLDAIGQCGARGIAAVVVFAAGYAEAGEEGARKQLALAAAARDAGVALVGPNCMGLSNLRCGIPLTFETVERYPGQDCEGVSIVAQSGAMANNIRDAMIARRLPITLSVSTGNEGGLGLEDYVEHFIADPYSRVIAVYAEQIRNPGRFLALARRARAAGKPLVTMMIGRSERAREAAQSHTGALTGDYATALALLRHEAVVVTATLDEMFDVIPLLLRHPAPPAPGLAFVTGSGAMKNIALDLGQDVGLSLPAFSDATVDRLRALLPGYAVSENPLDYTTVAIRDPALMGTVIDIVAADPNCGCLVVAQMGGSPMNQCDKATHMVPAVARAKKPAALVILGDGSDLHPTLTKAAVDSGVPFYRSADRALRAMALVQAYGEAVRQAGNGERSSLPGGFPHVAEAFPDGGTIAEYRGKGWLAKAGIPVPDGELAVDEAGAVVIAAKLGYPVVMKAQAAALPHKSDVGGVCVGLRDAGEVQAAWARLQANVARARPGLELDGILVERMGKPGVELVVGARRDAQWGPVVMVGLGGIWIEVLKDVRLLSPQADETRVLRELDQLKAAGMLHGLRGQPAVDCAAVARVVARIGALMTAMTRVREIDINPLVATADGVMALDALIVCDPA